MKKLILFLAIVSSIVLITSCSKENTDYKFNEEININIGDKLAFENGDVLELISVVDHRCCCLCLCFWEGYLEYNFKATINNEVFLFQYNDHENFENPLPFDDWEIEIVKITPKDNCDESIKLDKYVFTIMLIK
jgi:hypothetical protein